MCFLQKLVKGMVFHTKRMGILLPTGSKEREVLGIGNIPVAILPSCQDMNTFELYLQKYEFNKVVKMGNISEAEESSVSKHCH